MQLNLPYLHIVRCAVLAALVHCLDLLVSAWPGNAPFNSSLLGSHIQVPRLEGPFAGIHAKVSGLVFVGTWGRVCFVSRQTFHIKDFLVDGVTTATKCERPFRFTPTLCTVFRDKFIQVVNEASDLIAIGRW